MCANLRFIVIACTHKSYAAVHKVYNINLVLELKKNNIGG